MRSYSAVSRTQERSLQKKTLEKSLYNAEQKLSVCVLFTLRTAIKLWMFSKTSVADFFISALVSKLQLTIKTSM